MTDTEVLAKVRLDETDPRPLTVELVRMLGFEQLEGSGGYMWGRGDLVIAQERKDGMGDCMFWIECGGRRRLVSPVDLFPKTVGGVLTLLRLLEGAKK